MKLSVKKNESHFTNEETENQNLLLQPHHKLMSQDSYWILWTNSSITSVVLLNAPKYISISTNFNK